MLNQDPFAGFLSDIHRNLQIVEELESTLKMIHDTASRTNLDSADSEGEDGLGNWRSAAAF